MDKTFWKAGHRPTLLAAFLYFDLAFMVWVMLGPLGVQIAKDLGLTHAQKGMMVATPVLAGAILRIFMGILVDHLKPKLAGAIGQVIVIVSLFFAWYFGIHSYEQTLILGVFLGVAGASFAVALPLASRWYPPQHQGTAMGIAGAGNSGTALAALIAPEPGDSFRLEQRVRPGADPAGAGLRALSGRRQGRAQLPAGEIFRRLFEVLKDKDAWWFMFFYSVTFGGFVGLASSLTIYFNAQYGLDPRRPASSPPPASSPARWCDRWAAQRRRPRRRHQEPVGHVRTGSDLPRPSSVLVCRHVDGCCSRLRRRDAGAGHGQRRRVPAGAAALPQGDRRHDRAGRHGRRHRRLLSRLQPRLIRSRRPAATRWGFLIFAALALFALVGLTGVKKRWRTTWGAAHLTAAKI
jgi:NNP family nitrate/nitrite transporter-like MFS transporter